MPAYTCILTNDEVIATLAYIKSSWPANVLKMQKQITLSQQR